MHRLTNRLPSYRLHKASGQAIVTLNGRDIYLGPHNTEESRDRYKLVIQEWLVSFKRLLGLGSYQTAWAWLHKLRRAMVCPGRDCLEGVVETDESYLGGEKPGKRGRGARGKALVLLAVQLQPGDKIGRIRLAQVSDASGPSLVGALETMVTPGSKIKTDGWSGYNDLASKGYRHTVVRRSAEIGQDLLPACHHVAGLLKRWLLGTHRGAVRHEHLAYYLDEFTFRFNRRTSASRGKLFYRLAQQAVHVEPAPYAKLIRPHL